MKAWQYRGMTIQERIDSFTVVDDKTGCHVYSGRKDSYGYAQVKDGPKAVLLHRWVYINAHGDIGDLHVLHKCDNRSCINIDHLFLGTHAENMKDMKEKKRCNPPTGFSHKRPMAKLTNEQVIEIKNLLQRGYKQADIARDFKVSRQIISDISLNKTWQHIKI